MKIIGIILIILGVLLGGYLTLYVGLYGGICQIINGINPIIAKNIALGILRIIFCELGLIPTYVMLYFGMLVFYKK